MKDKKIFKDLGVGDVVYYFYDHQIITNTESITYIVKKIEYNKELDSIRICICKRLDSYYEISVNLSQEDYKLKSIAISNEYCLATNFNSIQDKVIEKLKNSIKTQEKIITNCENEIQKISEIIHKFKYYNEDTSI